MSERWLKFQMLAWRFFFWITPRWLSRKYQVFMMRRIVKHDPAEVERQMREQAREMSGGSKEFEDQLVAWFKNCLDSALKSAKFGRLRPRSNR